MDFNLIIEKQREFFETDKTKDIDFRIEMLKRLRNSIKNHEEEIYEALRVDLKKSPFESLATEVGIVYDEIDYILKNLKKWAKVKRVRTPIYNWPSKSYIYEEPYGVVLIIGPFNYPFQLNIAPLVGAMAAGNCALIKPSQYSKETTLIIMKIIEECFPKEYVAVIEPFGGREEVSAILKEKYDYIFFTGSVAVGKIVMEAASKHLTPVTLELGGKSPALLDEDCDVSLAAKRIAWGKFINAGQTCVAPDYVLVHHSIKDEFIKKLKFWTEKFYGKEAMLSKDYPKIIDNKQFQRLIGYLSQGKLVMGGSYNNEKLYIAPTALINVSEDSPLMTDEIFGPLLPILEYKDLKEAVKFINCRPKPLALYYFTKDKEKGENIIKSTSSGGGCINDTIMHVASTSLPFGGVGDSGMGSYHGKKTFETFSHSKSFIKRGNVLDFNFRYPPYKNNMKLLKKIFK